MRIVFVLCLLFPFSLNLDAQSNKAFTGSWSGMLDIGGGLSIVFHVKENNKGGLITTADSPDQSAYGIPCDTTYTDKNTITIEIRAVNASFSGKLVNDSTLDGILTQGGEVPLLLKKGVKPSGLVRPQTPKPPFPYKSEDVIYSNPDKSLQFGGTITIPEGKGPFPAVVLITGSGAQDRDETLLGHKIFAVLADHLTRNGILVLRVDDRGVGKTTGDFSIATTADFAKDASASVDYLISRSEADKKKLGLIGHSEGGMIAPMVATERNDINFIVLLAAPGVPIIDLMAAQNEAIGRSAGISDSALKEVQPLFKRVVTTILNAKDSISAYNECAILLENWSKTKSKSLVAQLHLSSVSERQEYLKQMIDLMGTPWFRYFINFLPRQYLEQLQSKVLAMNGDKDIQVLADQNLEGIRRSLEKSRVKKFDIIKMPDMNHLFQTCNKCTLEEYGEIQETFSPLALKTISDWIIKNVK